MLRAAALRSVIIMYVVVQLLSYVLLQVACSPYNIGGLWLHGALGPLAAVEAVPRFQYHSLPGNIAFVAGCLMLFAAPFAYVMRPRRVTLALSLVGLILWWLFGLGFTIRHM